jgi:ADP-ribosyl-[dinitrogen reductase] hydrolase
LFENQQINSSIMNQSKVVGGILGVAIGDALGVPVEFSSRETLQRFPVVDMRAFGVHHQPLGTWSDDSSLTFCLAESLVTGYDLKDLASRFVNWYNYSYWTAHEQVFDVGIATSQAIHQLAIGVDPIKAGGKDEYSNGNGSLMRILPLLYCIKDKPIAERFEKIKEVSSLTHGHIRSIIACFYYLEFARNLLEGCEKFETFEKTKHLVNTFLTENQIAEQKEIDLFHRLLLNPIGDYEIKPIFEYKESEISSSGYVVHTLEASIWCLLNSNSYSETVLKAVNLGSDTDTTGAVVGGLAGILYGEEGILDEWKTQLVKSREIRELAVRLFKKMAPSV